MDWKTQTITLSFPIPNGAETLREIKLREPDVDALEQIEELGLKENVLPTIKQLRGVIVALSGVPTETIGKLHRTDLEAIGEATLPLLGGEEEKAKA